MHRYRILGIWFSLLIGAPILLGTEKHALFTEVLQTHVDDRGLVNYRALASDHRLDEYLLYLEKSDVSLLATDKDRLAFWINAYNAFTLKLIIDNYPLNSIHELHDIFSWKLAVVTGKSIWDKPLVTVDGEVLSLFDIELKQIWEAHKDPRIHFAIVCASKSCPKLRREAYEGGALDEQLDHQTRSFLANQEKNRFDRDKSRANVSEIFNWYKKHFGSNRKERLQFISRYAPEQVKVSILSNIDDWKIKFIDYDWELNEQPTE